MRSLAAAVLAAGALVLGVAGPSVAADEVTIDHVESKGGTVSVLLGVEGLPAGVTPDLGSIRVSLDSEPVSASTEEISSGQIERTTILVLDASNSMRGERFEAAKAAASTFLDSAPDDVRVGLLTFSARVQEQVAPTTDHDAVAERLDSLELTGGTHVYEALTTAVDLAGRDGARSVLLLSDGVDQGGSTTRDEATAAATDHGVVVDVVALQQRAGPRAELELVAGASGGRALDAVDPAALDALFRSQADALAHQILVTFPAPADPDAEAGLQVSLKAGGQRYADSAYVSLATAEEPLRTVTTPEPLLGANGLLLGAVALGLGLAGILVVVLTGSRGPSRAQQQIAAYLGEAAPAGGPGRDQDGRRRTAGASDVSSLRDAAVDGVQGLLKKDFEARLAGRLSGAGSSLTAAEWLLLHAGITVLAGFVGLVLRGGAAMVVLGLLGGVLPWLWLRRRHAKRLAAFNAQLAETLTLMAGGLSAGLSLPQAVDTVVREGHEPMAGELRRVLIEQRLGIEIEDALDALAERMDSQDFSWVVMAVRIQREVGGNLAELLNTVADTLREREYLRRQVKVLSAEGRFSAWILAGLPPVMFIYMLFVRQDYVAALYTTAMGWALLGAGGVLLGSGIFVMSRMVKVEV